MEPDQNSGSNKVRVLPKRVRYYHAIIDDRSLKSSEEPKNLKNVIVIFICSYDPFGRDRIWYTVQNRCIEEPDVPYDDGTKTIFLYTRGTKGQVSVKYMKQFERDNMMRAEGREEERKNTEREHARAERECARADKERTRANALEAELKRLKSKML